MYNVHHFTFKGQDSDEFDLIVKSEPTRTIPKRKHSVVDIPGRNGALIQMQDALESIEITYRVMVYSGRASEYFPDDAYEQIEAIAEWLLDPGSPEGNPRYPYNTLSDSYVHTEEGAGEWAGYWDAVYVGPTDIALRLRKYGEAEIKFLARPQFYLHEDPETLEPEGEITIENNFFMDYSPTIRLTAELDTPPSMLNWWDREQAQSMQPTEPTTYYVDGLDNGTLSITDEEIRVTGQMARDAFALRFPVEAKPCTKYALDCGIYCDGSMVTYPIYVTDYNQNGRSLKQRQLSEPMGEPIRFTTEPHTAYIVVSFLGIVEPGEMFRVWDVQLEEDEGRDDLTYVKADTISSVSIVFADPTYQEECRLTIEPAYGTMMIDSDTMTVRNNDSWRDLTQSTSILNTDGSYGFPVFKAGKTTNVTLLGTATGAEIDVRRWKLL